MIRKVKAQADHFDIKMKLKFGLPMTHAECDAREKAIGEMNMVKKLAAAKAVLEQMLQRAEVKAKKQAAKGKTNVAEHFHIVV